ncbi:MAG: hypothetical protein QOI07_363 [Verrucomicrobiota bacterium]
MSPDYSGPPQNHNPPDCISVVIVLVLDLLPLHFDYDYEQEHEHDRNLHFPLSRIKVSAPPATPREDLL